MLHEDPSAFLSNGSGDLADLDAPVSPTIP